MPANKTDLANIGQNWPNLVAAFSGNYRNMLTSSEIAKKTGYPRRTVSRVLGRMVNMNLLRYVVEGRNKKYYIDTHSPKARLMMQMSESAKSLEFAFKKKKVFVILKELMQKNEVVLFGSYAKGNATKESDIDLLMIGKENKEIRKIARKQGMKVNIHFSTINEFKKLLKKKNTLALEILRNHIVFGGASFIDLCWEHYKK